MVKSSRTASARRSGLPRTGTWRRSLCCTHPGGLDAHEASAVPPSVTDAVLDDVVAVGDHDQFPPALMCHRLAAHRLEELACASQSARPIGGDRVVHHVRCAEPVERRQVIGAQQLVERGQYPLVSSTLIGTLLESSGENTVSPRRVRPARQHSAHTTHIGDRERYAVYRHVSSTRRHRRRRTGGPGRGRLRLRHARLGHTQHRSVRPTRRGTARTTRAAPRRPREHPVGRSAARDGRCESPASATSVRFG
jgi:hypothetical protein